MRRTESAIGVVLDQVYLGKFVLDSGDRPIVAPIVDHGVTCPECGSEVVGERIHAFKQFHELWRENWDERLRTLPPDAVTAEAIKTKRSEDPERLIVHYNQPHHPFLYEDGETLATVFDTPSGSNIWDELRKGAVTREEVWEAYVENLRYVLDSLPTLLTNIDADRVVITSDHGNALGEWGVYGHPNPPVPISVLVDVPWIETCARNTAVDQPEDIARERDAVEDDVSERLRDLGYR